MKIRGRRSFRTTLTLWNVSMLAITLVAAGLVLAFGSRAALLRAIDRDLQDRGRAAARPPGPPPGAPGGFLGGGPGGPGGFGPPGQPGEPPGGGPPPPGPDFRGSVPRRPPDGTPQGQPGQQPPSPQSLRAPRRFDSTGKPRGPGNQPPYDPVALQRALSGWEGFSDAQYDDMAVRVYTVPIRNGGGASGALQVARDLSDLQELWVVQGQTLALFLPVAVLVGAGVALFLTNRALRPIRELTRTASAITASDLSRRLEVTGDDELASLATSFNSMLSRLDSAFDELREAYELQRRFTADASHELRTPLARMRLATSAALEAGADAKQMREALTIAASASKDMSALVEQLLTLAKSDAGRLTMQLEPMDLRVLVAEVIDEANAGSQLHLSVPDHSVTVTVDAPHLKRAVANLVANALRHSSADSPVTVTMRQAEGSVEIDVADKGEGIASEHLPHLGERFYRIDTARTASSGGTGLGLAITKAIVEAHGGSLRIDSQVGIGTTAKISLPSPEHRR